MESSLQETLYAIALTKMDSIDIMSAHVLYDTMGSATAVFENRHDIKSFIPDATQRLQEAILNTDNALRLAEKELDFMQGKNVRCIIKNDSSYPDRLRQCADAPLVLYYCGNADLNRTRIVSMVGTRKCTPYGQDICRTFVADLKKSFPDILIVSGLAYGIDIHSHQAALSCGMDTVGILAHGLDRIYPQPHRPVAVEMTQHGGLLTEYTSGTTPEKVNFVRRNRIVAGISDACVVVESAAKGGSLITAQLAFDYNREVFAFPGRINDAYSAGCNKIIAQHQATLIQSAADFLTVMGWNTQDNAKKRGTVAVQRELFPVLSAEEQKVVNALANGNSKMINQLSADTNINYSTLSSMLFDMEMKGIVATQGGGKYRLLMNV